MVSEPSRPDVHQLSLFDAGAEVSSLEPAAEPERPAPPDAAERAYAVDPTQHVVLEASAGTGKTSVLVQRYCNLLAAGVDPANILAITFTRKAAAEMRERIVRKLRQDALSTKVGMQRWRQLRDRVADIAISTIDAFCLALLREFPLEADLDPSFRVADDTEIARLIERALDHALRAGRALAQEDDTVALVLTEMTTRQLRLGLRHLLDRRSVAMPALAGFIARANAPISAVDAVDIALGRVGAALTGTVGGAAAFLATGPMRWSRFRLLARDLGDAIAGRSSTPAERRRVLDHLADYFLTQKGEPRVKLPASRSLFDDDRAHRQHKAVFAALGPEVAGVLDQFDRDVNAVLARGVQRLALIAQRAYLRSLEDENVLDFTETLERAVRLLEQMDEFSRSRYRLESRYHHVLVDEFQDTSRLQWRLVSLLVEAWRAGEGTAAGAPLPPSVFVVGDRKQSIYRFRDADVVILDEASRHIASLRPNARPHRAITTSFRSAPALLAFVNDLFDEIEKSPGRTDAFRYDERDRFPLPDDGWLARSSNELPLGLAVGATPAETAAQVADEIVHLVSSGAVVRDRDTGVRRPARPGDVAILFRSRDSHREYESALGARGVPTYVYKGLGFFGADEIQDLAALIRFLAQPDSRNREAAFLRSRFVRISDAGLTGLVGDLGRVLRGRHEPASIERLDEDDRAVVRQARTAARRWLAWADRLPPADVLDAIVRETAFAFEMRGSRYAQARENVKKFRGLLRRIQNRGYATLGRIADHLDRLSAGDESNAAIDAVNAVNLMTVHASKGLEFPIVFVVNLSRGTGTGGPSVRVVADAGDGEPAVSIGTLRFEADEEEKRRDREETKRLLYVAVTRARDRLYLSTSLGREGRFIAGPGSLAEVLPRSFTSVLAASAGGGESAEWTAGSRVHRFVRCQDSRNAETDIASEVVRAEVADVAPVDLLDRVDALPDVAAMPVRAAVQEQPRNSFARDWDHAGIGDALAGRLVHRLFQALDPTRGTRPDNADVALRNVAAALLLDEERAVVHDLDAVLEAACSTFRTLQARADVEALFAGSQASYEVPFSLRLEHPHANGPAVASGDGVTVVRGAIDCLLTTADNDIIVVEIKTGRPMDWHHRQLALYVKAAEALYPGRRVRGVLVSPDVMGSGF